MEAIHLNQQDALKLLEQKISDMDDELIEKDKEIKDIETKMEKFRTVLGFLRTTAP